MKCTIHKNREAVGKCIKCSRYFCSSCVEKIGRNYICFDCLKKVAKESLRKKSYKSLTVPLMLAVGIFAAMGIAALALRFDTLLALIQAFTKNALPEYIAASEEKIRELFFSFLKALLFFFEAYLISMNKLGGFFLGILISLLLIGFASASYPAISNTTIIFEILLPLLALLFLILSRKEFA